MLKLFMEPLGLSAYRVATDVEVPPIAISEILRGMRAISPVMALKLGTYFGVDPHFWMALQSSQELKLAAAAVKSVMQESESPPPPLKRCAALADRAFVVRESLDDTGQRRWEVMLAKARAAAAPAARKNSETKKGREAQGANRQLKRAKDKD